MNFLKKIRAVCAKFLGEPGNIFLLVGTLFSALAAILVAAILVRFVNFSPRGTGSYKIFYGTGDVLVSAYGFSSILIPFFLIAASLCCFYKRANLKSAFLLLSALAPFFTIAITEGICRAIFATAGDRFFFAKFIFAVVISALLLSIEIIGSIMLSDKFVTAVMRSRLFASPADGEKPAGEPVKFFSDIDGSIQPLDLGSKAKPDPSDLTKTLNEVLKKTQEATEKIEKYAQQKEKIKSQEEVFFEPAGKEAERKEEINLYGEMSESQAAAALRLGSLEPLAEEETAQSEAHASAEGEESLAASEESVSEEAPHVYFADLLSEPKGDFSKTEASVEDGEAGGSSLEHSPCEDDFSSDAGQAQAGEPAGLEAQAEETSFAEANREPAEENTHEACGAAAAEIYGGLECENEEQELPKLSAVEQYPEYRDRERIPQQELPAEAAEAKESCECAAESLEAETPDAAKDVFLQMEEDIRHELGLSPRPEDCLEEDAFAGFDSFDEEDDLEAQAAEAALGEAEESCEFSDSITNVAAIEEAAEDEASGTTAFAGEIALGEEASAFSAPELTADFSDGEDSLCSDCGLEGSLEDGLPAADCEAAESGSGSSLAAEAEIAAVPKARPAKKTVTLPPPKTEKKFTGKYEVATDLLVKYEDDQYWVIDDETELAALALKDTLNEFNIEAQIIDIKKGPVVTMFEILPAPGVKLSKIVALQDNIALRLAASSVRIVAPIPGKRAVGIEIPNKARSIVGFREIIEMPLEEYGKMAVPVILGKDILGKPQVIDLVKTPHLLIAGATGAGKSVCVNSMILSILYKRSPSEVRLIMIDPKIVELKLYNDIPHLLTPVITEPKKAFQSLQYCLAEMERRYSLLDALGVRDISSYNRRIEDRKIATEKLPYIIVIIDEFADLMATTGKELEQTLARLAAMSRAVGIHLVLATQRPSIDVITGLIKANIPSRIAFMVASKMDSRIIVDQVGAEKLLGKGDMLYASAVDPFPVRIQGTFVTDDEVESVVTAVKAYSEPDYIDDEIFIDDDESNGEQSIFDGGEDPLYAQALDVVLQSGKASASYIQRRLKIGYNRAARLVEEMEMRGIVGPANGSKPREIIHVPS